LEAELADFDALSDELLFDAELSVEAAWCALLAVSASVLELALVELLDEPPLAAVRVSAPLPVVVEVAPPPEPELLCVELPDEPAVEGF
jgi:hypothetical protein